MRMVLLPANIVKRRWWNVLSLKMHLTAPKFLGSTRLEASMNAIKEAHRRISEQMKQTFNKKTSEREEMKRRLAAEMAKDERIEGSSNESENVL